MTRDELQTVLEVLDQCELSDPDFVSKWKRAHDIVKAALEAPTAGTMNSAPHILDIEFALDEMSKEMLDIERRRREDPANEHAKGEHRAYFSMKIQFMALLANWRRNVPVSRKAEILINGEKSDEGSTS